MLLFTLLLVTVAALEEGTPESELTEYFTIKSQINDLVMCLTFEGSGVGMTKSSDVKKEICTFYMDETSHTIRGSPGDVCLTNKVHETGRPSLVMEECKNSREQQWDFTGHTIRSLSDHRIICDSSPMLCDPTDHEDKSQLYMKYEKWRQFHYFFIKSQENDLVMEVEGGSHEPGTLISLSTKKSHSLSSRSQLFYEDQSVHTIYSSLTDFCLTTRSKITVEGQNLLPVVENYSGGEDQAWDLEDNMIRSRDDGLVIGIETSNLDTKLKLVPDVGAAGIHWVFENVALTYFCIQSKADLGKGRWLLDVHSLCTDPGTDVLVYPKKTMFNDNQIWFHTGNGVFRSRLNAYTLDSCFDKIRLYPYREWSQSQGFRLVGDRIINSHDQQCLDVRGKGEDSYIRLYSQPCKDKMTQRWEIVPA